MADETATGPVLARSIGAVTVLTLNRPDSLNAIDHALAKELQSRLGQVGQDRQCRCLVLVGSGRGFCSGQALPASTEELPEDIEGLIRDRYVPVVTGIRNLMIPVLAAVNGVATGAGFSLALAADIRVASEAAWFSCGFAKIGLVPDAGATYFLPRFLGLPRSIQLALSGERISAEAAQQLGLVAQVYPPESFEQDYLRFAQELASGPTAAFGRTKQALCASLESTLDQQLEREAQLQQASCRTDDFREGIRAFNERRPPQFRGR
jgi:2-(1,2-epoxy-1,2-dihydrophenyl)acetyl-CoA isomerase